MSISYTKKSVSSHDKNSLKSLMPCFIEDILQAESSEEFPMTQKGLREEIEDSYGVRIGRQALGRHVNTILSEENAFHIYGNAKKGYFFSEEYGKHWEDAEEEDFTDEEEPESPALNDRESLLCSFMRSILMEASNYRKPLTQEALLRKLECWPYEVTMDRRAVARTLETLISVYPDIHRSGEGYFYDRMGYAA